MFPLNCSLSVFQINEYIVKTAYCCGLWTWIFGQTLWTGGIKFYDQHTSVTAHSAGVSLHAYVLSCRPHPRRRWLEQGGCWAGKVQIKQLERRLMWPLWLTRNWRSCFNVICACWTARRPPVADSLSIHCAFQAASKDRPWDNYRRFALFRMEGVLAYVHWWPCNCCCEFNLCRRATDMSDVRSFTILSDLVSLHDRETSLALAYEVRY